MIKKIGIYVLFAMFGLALGYFFFGTSENHDVGTTEVVNSKTGKWTCSMHPQIHGEENGKCPLCAMDLVFMDDNVIGNSQEQFKMSEDAIALANIETVKVDHFNAKGTKLKLSGLITTNQKTDAVQTTLFDGRVDKLYVNYVGKKVGKGQEIGQIYSPELYLAQDKLLTSASYRDTHQKLYDAARNSLGLWKMTDAQIDSILSTDKPMVNFPLYADVSGTVTEILASEGNYYSQGEPLFKTSDLRTVWAIFDAYESQLEMLEIGQEVEVELNGLQSGKINSKITFIEPILNKDKRTVSVRVVLDNNGGRLKPGMFAEALVNTKISNDELIAIPKSAVLWTGKRSLVYKKPFANQPIFEMAEVELGQHFENEYEILNGLQYGDVVVSQGAFTIDAAAQLSGKRSMMFHESVEGHEHHNDHMKMELKDFPSNIEISIDFEKNFESLMESYIRLKDALVATDHELAQKNAEKFLDQINKNKLVSNSELGQVKSIKTRLQNIQQSTAIDNQRKEFKYLSEDMIAILSSMTDFSSTLYVQHCDCADSFKGGSWVSYDENILNPYFGDAMLTCGRVEQVFN